MKSEKIAKNDLISDKIKMISDENGKNSIESKKSQAGKQPQEESSFGTADLHGNQFSNSNH